MHRGLRFWQVRLVSISCYAWRVGLSSQAPMRGMDGSPRTAAALTRSIDVVVVTHGGCECPRVCHMQFATNEFCCLSFGSQLGVRTRLNKGLILLETQLCRSFCCSSYVGTRFGASQSPLPSKLPMPSCHPTIARFRPRIRTSQQANVGTTTVHRRVRQSIQFLALHKAMAMVV